MTDYDDLLARAEKWFGWIVQTSLRDHEAEAVVAGLAAAVRDLRGRPCPHIETSDDGTSHCTLAEAANKAWAVRWQEQHDRAERAEIRLAKVRDAASAFQLDDDERLIYEHSDGECCAIDVSCPSVREVLAVLLAVPDRPGGTDNPTSDCPNCGEPDCQDSCAEERFQQALKLAGDRLGGDDGR